jgi:hypothetical protein
LLLLRDPSVDLRERRRGLLYDDTMRDGTSLPLIRLMEDPACGSINVSGGGARRACPLVEMRHRRQPPGRRAAGLAAAKL